MKAAVQRFWKMAKTGVWNKSDGSAGSGATRQLRTTIAAGHNFWTV